MANQNPFVLNNDPNYGLGTHPEYYGNIDQIRDFTRQQSGQLGALYGNRISQSANPNDPTYQMQTTQLPSNEYAAAIAAANLRMQNAFKEKFGINYGIPQYQLNPEYVPKTVTTQEVNPNFNPQGAFSKNALFGGMGSGGSSAITQARSTPTTEKSTQAYPGLATSSLNQLRQNLASSGELDQKKRDIQKYLPTGGYNAKEIY